MGTAVGAVPEVVSLDVAGAGLPVDAATVGELVGRAVGNKVAEEVGSEEEHAANANNNAAKPMNQSPLLDTKSPIADLRFVTTGCTSTRKIISAEVSRG